MPTTQKKHTTKTTKRRTSGRAAQAPKKRKAKKPKIVLSAKGVYLLSGIIVAVCALSLAFSIFMARPQNDEKKPSAKNERVVSEAKPAETVASQPKTQKPRQENLTVQTETKKNQKTERAPSAPQKKETVLVPSKDTAVASAKPDRQPVVAPPAPEKPAPKSPFTIPPAKNGATLVFVLDDAGLHPEYVREYTALPFPVAIAVLPGLLRSKECAEVVRAGHKELMLHQPMQAHEYADGTVPNPGQGAILPGMHTAEIAQTIKKNLDEIGPGVKGLNNHEGSLVTEDVIKMGAVLEVASERGIFFLDSRTTAVSAVPQAALERDMRYIARYAPFLDNKVERQAILSELYKGLDVANKNGYAIIIGHVDKSVGVLPQLLKDIYPYLVRQGYRFATPSQL